MRFEMPDQPGAFGMSPPRSETPAAAIGAVDMRSVARTRVTRDVTIGDRRSDDVANGRAPSSRSDRRRADHLRLRLDVPRAYRRQDSGRAEDPVKTRNDLSIVYTPGVARVSLAIAEDPRKAFQLTIKRNTVAVVTDGTAVLGLGDIGPLAALPVMEGKAMLFKQFADIDALPICLATKDVDEIVDTVVRIAPVFGGINLEDISAPRCFEVEQKLIERLDIPVMHDDQHGTAVVIMAALINAALVVGKRLEDLQVVVVRKRRGRDGDDQDAARRRRAGRDSRRRTGALNRIERYENPHWRWLAENCNRDNRRGSLGEVLEGVDVFIGVSAPGILQPEDIGGMARDPIVFAMANPTPEIMPDVAAPVAALWRRAAPIFRTKSTISCVSGNLSRRARVRARAGSQKG